MRPAEANIGALLDALVVAEVEYVIVGGVAVFLHGAPMQTRDLDIVPRQTPENLDRLHALLGRLDAIMREPGSRELRVRREWLDGTGQILLRTSLGPLDILLRLHDGQGYEDLAPRAVERAADGLSVKLIDLPALIAIKASTGRWKDRMTVPLLVDLLAARERGEGPSDDEG